jgi:hypothetical protein
VSKWTDGVADRSMGAEDHGLMFGDLDREIAQLERTLEVAAVARRPKPSKVRVLGDEDERGLLATLKAILTKENRPTIRIIASPEPRWPRLW